MLTSIQAPRRRPTCGQFLASGNCQLPVRRFIDWRRCGTITAAQDGSNNYNSANPVARTFSIGKADQQITFAAPADRKLGDADFDVIATASSNLTVGLAAAGNCTLNGSQVHLTGAGQCTVTASQDGNADYNAVTPVARTFAIGKADQQITFEALANKTVGDADLRQRLSGLAVARRYRKLHLNGAQVMTGAGVHHHGFTGWRCNYNAASPVARHSQSQG